LAVFQDFTSGFVSRAHLILPSPSFQVPLTRSVDYIHNGDNHVDAKKLYGICQAIAPNLFYRRKGEAEQGTKAGMHDATAFGEPRNPVDLPFVIRPL
jgi:hypothetical protein